MDELKRMSQNKNLFKRVTTAQRSTRVDGLREKIAQGQGQVSQLTQQDGTQAFVYGQTPMDDPFFVL